MLIKLTNIQNYHEEADPSVITYGYDKCERSWCIIVKDEDDNEIESSYVGTKEGCQHEIEYFKEKYGISKVEKYKAY